MLHKTSLLLLLLAAFASAKVVNFQNCPDSVDECSINQVRVDPCRKAATRACHIRRRHPTTMSFDFTPSFDAERLEVEELPLDTMERDACRSTTCPVQAGKIDTYSLTLPIKPNFPTGPNTIRWTLKDPVSGKRCCFTVDINVLKN